MIHVFFVPGMFGSTVEYVLRSFTEEYKPIQAEVLPDGSMHSFEKEFHPLNLKNFLNLPKLESDSITTPIYPFADSHLPEIIKSMEKRGLTDDAKLILIHSSNLCGAELNMLFQYHKIAKSRGIKGLGIFCGSNEHCIINWNTNYKTWQDMQTWELREWLSLSYVEWVQEWIQSQYQVNGTFLKVNYLEILNNFAPAMSIIIKHCGLTEKPGLDKFSKQWRNKQQYIIDEFELLDQIVDTSINNVPFYWSPINVIAESIVQQRLRSLGYEIQCDGLNTFPTKSQTLHKLLEKF